MQKRKGLSETVLALASSLRLAISIEVKNGVSNEGIQPSTVKQVEDAKSYLEVATDPSIMVIGGIGYVRSRSISVNRPPNNVDFVLRFHYCRDDLLRYAIRDTLATNNIPEREKEIIERILKIERRRWNLHLGDFFATSEPKYWSRVGPHFPDFKTGGEFLSSISITRGKILESYVAQFMEWALISSGGAGEVRSRIRYCVPRKNYESDIDVLVLTTPESFFEALKYLKRVNGIESYIGRDLKRKLT